MNGNISNSNDQEIRFLANEPITTIGGRPIKLWEFLVGILILSYLLPFIFRTKTK